MEEIFKKIEGREWDYEIYNPYNEYEIKNDRLIIVTEKHAKGFSEVYYSLADLLANKSWCMAVWGDEWMTYSRTAFNFLQIVGHKACIDYILKTMI